MSEGEVRGKDGEADCLDRVRVSIGLSSQTD